MSYKCTCLVQGLTQSVQLNTGLRHRPGWAVGRGPEARRARARALGTAGRFRPAASNLWFSQPARSTMLSFEEQPGKKEGPEGWLKLVRRSETCHRRRAMAGVHVHMPSPG